MDIVITDAAGRRKSFYEFPSEVGAALVHAGIAFQIALRPPSAPPHTQTEWSVDRLPFSGKLSITCRRPGGEFCSFTGAPAAYKAGLKYCDSNCPEAVLNEYAIQFGKLER